MAVNQAPLMLPLNHPASVMFIDESGSKGSGGQFFVMAGIKTRRLGELLREVEQVRDSHRFRGELKFSGLTRNSLRLYQDLINVILRSDTHIQAFVIDKQLWNPFENVEQWEGRVSVTKQLTIGSTNKGEIVTLLMDDSSSPKGVSIPEQVRSQVNDKFGCTAVAAAIALKSQSNDGLQLADLVASAINFDRQKRANITLATKPSENSPKAIVTRQLAAAFGLPDFRDTRDERVNILTSAPRNTRPKLAHNHQVAT